MLAHRKALVAVLAGAGLCVAFLTVYLCRATLLELWCERQLRSEDPEDAPDGGGGAPGHEQHPEPAILLEYVEHPNPRDDPNAPIGELDIRRVGRVVAARGSAVVPQLREALGSKTAKVRWSAAHILFAWAPPAPGPPWSWERRSGDPDDAVRTTAAHTLRRLGPEARGALDALSGALSDPGLDDDIRWCAAEALGEIGPAAESAIPALEEATKADDHDLGAAASEALRRIRGE